jgi:hypothetical protein
MDLVFKCCLFATASLIVIVRGFPTNEKIESEETSSTFVLDDVGCLVTRDDSGISGKVHVVKNSNQLWISQFNFVKEQKDAYFNIALNGTRGRYKDNRMILNWPSPDLLVKKPLNHEDFAGQDIIITLPKSIPDPYQIRWFSVWCGDKSCADVVFNSIDKEENACVKEFKIVLIDAENADLEDIPAGFVPVTGTAGLVENEN